MMNKLARYLFILLCTNVLVFSIVSPSIFAGDIAFAAPPKAYGDSYSTSENTTLYVPPPGVLGNDTGDNLTASLWGGTANGTVSLNSDGSFTYTPNGGYVGTDSFAYKAFTGGQGSNTAVVTITVTAITNTPPVANSQTVTTSEDTTVAITLTAADADNDPLTYSIVTQPANGSLSGAPPSVTYTPKSNYVGSDGFTFKANDGVADSNIATVTITVTAVTNTPPVANSQTITTTKNTASSIALIAIDVDNDPLTYSIVTQPSNGALSGALPSITYTPNLDYVGSDSFTFKANDGTADSNTATVSITVTAITNNPPVAYNQIVTTSRNATTTITLIATDGDNDPLTYSIVSQPANGTISGTPPFITYKPNSDYVGSDNFTFKANDGTIDSNTAMVTINIVETPLSGGSEGDAEIQTTPGITNISTLIDNKGLFNKSLIASSDDSKVQLKINAGTIGKMIDGKPFTEIVIKKATTIRNPPKDVDIIGRAYEFGPSGVIFNLKVTINIKYNPENIPEGVSEVNLVIGYYDEETQAWISIDSVVNTLLHSVEAQTDHFSLYAVLSGPTTTQTIPDTEQPPVTNLSDIGSNSELLEPTTPATTEDKAMPDEMNPQKATWLYIFIGVGVFLLSLSTTIFVARRVYR